MITLGELARVLEKVGQRIFTGRVSLHNETRGAILSYKCIELV